MISFIQSDTLIATKLDSLILRNHQNFNELSKAIIATTNDSRLIEFVSNDTLFTLFITLLVFFLGGVVSWLFKRNEQSRKNKETRRFVKYYLDLIVPYVEQIEVGYKKVSETTTIDTGIDIFSPKVLKNDWRKILSIDAREIYSSFKEKEVINKIIRQLDVIDENVTMCEIYHSLLRQKTDITTEKMQIKYKAFKDSVLNYTEHIRKEKPDDFKNDGVYIFLNESILIHVKDVQDNYRNTSKFYNETLRPILLYLVDSNLFRISQYADNITNEAKLFSDLLFELTKELEDFKKQYADYSTNINKARLSIMNNMDKINWQ
jgi:hypothetical protein